MPQDLGTAVGHASPAANTLAVTSPCAESPGASTSDDHRAIEVEPLLISPSSPICVAAGDDADDIAESENGPPDGLFSGASQQWPSQQESPVDLVTQVDAVTQAEPAVPNPATPTEISPSLG